MTSEVCHRIAERWAVARLSNFIAQSVTNAREDQTPFPHIELRDIFPDEIYHAMLETWPHTSRFRAMSGRVKSDMGADGFPTRMKLDLLPEYTRLLPKGQRELWNLIGRALRSKAVQTAIMRRLESGLSERFGYNPERTRMYPIPILTRDRPGYKISPHQDTHWKGITVQIYLPSDDRDSHIGTIFHERLLNGEMLEKKRISFRPNSGYGFAVGEETWHSADTVGTEVATRDSILLTYFVDTFPGRYFRNRLKRLGNLILSMFTLRNDPKSVEEFQNLAGGQGWSTMQVSRFIILCLSITALAFWATMQLLRSQQHAPLREVTVLALHDLRSDIAGQPLTAQSGVIVSAPLGHPEGHIVYTVPIKIPEGEHRFETSVDFKVGKTFNIATCIVDVVEDGKIVAHGPVEMLHSTDSLTLGATFQSPAKRRGDMFQMRLYCDGRASVFVRNVKLIRNPSTPPSVIIQR